MQHVMSLDDDAGAPEGNAPTPSRPWRGASTQQVGLAFIAIWFCALSVQTVTLTGTIVDESGGPALKMYHGLLAGLALLLAARSRIVRWRAEVTVYFAVTVLTSLFAYLRFGPHPFMVNVIVAAYTATVGATLGAMAGPRAAVKALRVASLAMLAAVLVKDAMNLSAIILFLSAPNGHPPVPTFYGGGPNLEATWVALAGVFFIGSRLLAPYVLAAAAISAAYASRIGIIVAALVAASAGASALLSRRRGGARWRTGVLVCALPALAAGVAAAAQAVDGADYIAQRFASIGEDPGSVGRLTLWQGGVEVFAEHPFGVGQGNGVPAIERTLGVDLPEDNLHNQYLQHLVETGVPGLVAYLLLAGTTWWRLGARRLQRPMLLYVGIYFIVALTQFRGAEVLLWFIYGLESGVCAAEAQCRDG
jgi:putative inorganic carbon (hco3(-)) transporter